MKNILILQTVFIIALITSCSSNQPDHDESVVPKANNSKQLIDTSSSVMQAQPVILPANNSVKQTVTAANPVLASGKNPAHGQPGHRCDIAVGAPLNSPPSTASPAPVVTTTSNATVPAKNSAGVKLNPPHGEPGHDCKIAVGQPLN